MKVLLIEDNREIVEAISLIFQAYWSEAQLVSTHLGEEGIQMAESEVPDTIILDLGLPDINGFQVLSRIRRFSSTPVIILTASNKGGDRTKGFELGADDYMVKPFRQQELLERLKTQVARCVPTGFSLP